ncbi:MAG: substrate-binding domain-containing protein [Solirubrobacterales bacterium]
MPPLTTLIVGAVLVVGTRAVWPSPGCGPAEIAAQADPQGGADVVRVVVLSSSNKGALMAEMACRFELAEPTVDGAPLDVQIVSEPSGAAIDTIASGSVHADVWSPASSSWVSMLRLKQPTWIPDGRAPSIAQSPQVIAMPRPMAVAMGWPKTQIGWSDLFDLANDPSGWGRFGHPEWGAFKLGKTNPNFSTSGLNATVATYHAATHRSSDLTVADLQRPQVLAFVKAVESLVVHYAPTSMDFLRTLRAQDDRGRGEEYVSAVLLEEKSVWDYNQGNPSGDPATLGLDGPPQTPLVAFYPSDGAIVADHPYVILTADWVTASERTGAQEFLRFLEAPDQQQRFQALGFRDGAGQPGPEIDEENGLIPTEPTATIAPPGGEVLTQIRDAWPEYRKRARVLILMDVSGSMSAPVPGTDQTQMELAKAAALQALTQLGPDDEVGLWTFSPDPSAGAYVENVPIGPLSSNGDALRAAIGGLQPEGGTQLYATVEAAVRRMQAEFDPTKINGIILLSDGVNEDPTNDDRAAVIDAVGSELDREVRIFTIAYGDLADVDTLGAIARSSLGTAYDATDATDIRSVFDRVVANF